MKAPTALIVALVAALGYAAFAHGAARQPGEAWLEILLAATALGAAASALLGGSISASAQRPAWWGVGLLAAFAAWSGLTLLWSIAPDRTWEELNRALAYALVAGLGVMVGASLPRAAERFAVGFLLVVVAVAFYALGGKVVPGFHIHPFFDLDHTAAVARLRAPLEYWNALALLCVLAIPIAARLATDALRRPAVRVAALEAIFLLVLVAGLTYSRGAIVAFVVAAAVLTVAGGARLRGLAVLAAAGAAATLPLAVAFSRIGLKANGVPLATRIHEGRVLGSVVIAAALLLAGAGILALRLERRITWSDARSRIVWRGLAAAAAAGVLLFVLGLAFSERGLGGSVSHAARSFTETKQDRQFDPVRLLSTNSSNRWVWWNEAGGAWSDRPLGGWGAGSFALLHLRYRDQPVPVTQAHSVPMQMLAETGVIGLLLAYGGIAALFAAAVGRIRGMEDGRERDFAVALLAGGAAWLVHGIYDWDWNMPAVTAAALAMLGVVSGRPAVVVRSALSREERVRGGPAFVAVATLIAAVAIASAGLPAWSDGKADGAAEAAAAGTPAALQDAAARADLAARIDPLATRPLFVSAAIAQARGRLLDARADLLEAAGRQPDDPAVWYRLASLALRLADRDGFVHATRRALELDPVNPFAVALAARAAALTAPPASSATATGTPLAAAPAPGP